MGERLNIQIDCGECTPANDVDFKSSALDDVSRIQRGLVHATLLLSEIALYAYCPVARARHSKKVHIDLTPNMAKEPGDSVLSDMTLDDAKRRIIQTQQFICKPFNALCPKGFK